MFDAEELVEGCRKAAGVNAAACSDDDLLAAVAALEDARRALAAAQCTMVAELDARDVCDRRFGHRTRDWLGAQHHLERREAGRWCRIGRGLRIFHVIADALADGKLTVEHARVVVDAANPRVADVLAAAQAELIDLAATMRFEEWARHVRALADHADADGGHDPGPDRRSATVGRGLGGELFLSLTLLGDDAATVDHLVGTHTDRLLRRAATDRDTTGGDLALPTRAQLRADAVAELIRAGGAALHGGTPTAPAADVTLTIPHDHPALTGAGRGPAVRCGHGDHDLNGPALDVLLCDPTFTAVVLDGLGTPLDVGRAERYATRPQRRALAARDGGCAFPGCDAPPAWCDAHHVIPWDHGGDTDMHNLLLLCRHHHRVIHRPDWHLHHTGHQNFQITTPGGRTLTAQRHGQPHDPSAPPPPERTPAPA